LTKTFNKHQIFAHLASTSNETFQDRQIAGTIPRSSTETLQNHMTF
jgi:hypothetical protein